MIFNPEGALSFVNFQAKVFVTLKEGVLDPQGKAVQNGLASMGYGSVDDVRVGRYILMRVGAEDAHEAERRIDEMCHRLLANPVIEDYRFEVSEEE